MDNRPIGIFDSGVGGLTVVRQIMSEMPKEEIVYFGDTARVPYGSKSREIVTKFSRQIIHFLLTKNVKAIIVACNTVSSNSLDVLKEEFDIPIFGVVLPGAEEAVKTTKNKKVGIIGTAATIRSGAYKKLICQIDPLIKVYSKACPLFVPLVEEGWIENEITTLTVEKYLREIVETGVDSIVLGCTHYPLLKSTLKKTVGPEIKLVDPALSTAKVVKKYLEENKLCCDENNDEPFHKFFISDSTDIFNTICQKALSQTFSSIQIDIEKF